MTNLSFAKPLSQAVDIPSPRGAKRPLFVAAAVCGGRFFGDRFEEAQ
jgi:hypothetical protein